MKVGWDAARNAYGGGLRRGIRFRGTAQRTLVLKVTEFKVTLVQLRSWMRCHQKTISLGWKVDGQPFETDADWLMVPRSQKRDPGAPDGCGGSPEKLNPGTIEG